ncbi:hypothetical protein ES703_87168 [subsurface metagenome]
MLRILKCNNGIFMLETIVGLAIFSAVGVVFLSGLAIGMKSEKVHGHEANSQILATSTMEFVKSQPSLRTPGRIRFHRQRGLRANYLLGGTKIIRPYWIVLIQHIRLTYLLRISIKIAMESLKCRGMTMVLGGSP